MSNASVVSRWVGDGVAAEGVEHEDVELLRLLAFERQPGVAEHDLDVAGAVGEEGEVLAGEAFDVGVDLVEAVRVAGLGVGGQRADAEADEADLRLAGRGNCVEREADAAAFAVVERRLASAPARGTAAPWRRACRGPSTRTVRSAFAVACVVDVRRRRACRRSCASGRRRVPACLRPAA